MRPTALAAAGLLLAVTALTPAESAMKLPNETYTLPNGLTVILHEDHRLPQVTIDTWFRVGSKDEVPGRTGFAHLFEHLMFMGTARVPGNQFDMLMETGGGSNNASTSTDRTNYYSVGPSSVLPLLLWLDADRLESLGASMTQEKLDLQREVVRNERRQSYENTPYGAAGLIIPDALYPAGHPYHHPVIGSHEDLEAASLQDVKDFFATHYVPGNATLVVAGDFDPAQAKALVASTFGAVPARPMPAHRAAAPVALDHEVRRLATDKVEFPRLYLVWPAPPAFQAGTAELELLRGVLGGGPSSRLEKRLVLETRLAQSVQVYLDDRVLGSEFHVHVTAAPGADLEQIKRETLAVIDAIAADGPSAKELERVKAQDESESLSDLENLEHRADAMNAYYYFFGVADGYARDRARYAHVTPADVRDWTRRTLGEGRVDLRIIPEGAKVANAALDKRPADLPPGRLDPPAPQQLKLANGIEVDVVPQRGTGLFAAHLVVDGGERLVPPAQSGLASLAAHLATSGAGGKSAPEFAEAVESLGGHVEAYADRYAFQMTVTGLASRLEPTLDLFADAVRRPNLATDDFQREQSLALAAIRSRGDRPNAVAGMVTQAVLYGRDDVRGRPVEGYAATVSKLTPDAVRSLWPRLVDPSRARIVVVGDVDPASLQKVIDARFGTWKPAGGGDVPPRPAPVTAPKAGRFVLVDRPGAPQTVILVARPVAVPDEPTRAARHVINNIFGGTFTSRLNQNLREKNGFTYGAGSAIGQDGPQFQLRASSAVQREVTGRALAEFRREFAAIAGGNISAAELAKATETARFDLVESIGTTHALASTLAELVADERPADALKRHAEALGQVSLDAVNREARSGLFAWKDLAVVLVGDRKDVLPQLEKAGFTAPEIVDVEGNPVR